LTAAMKRYGVSTMLGGMLPNKYCYSGFLGTFLVSFTSVLPAPFGHGHVTG
jgi:hypothetical protein